MPAAGIHTVTVPGAVDGWAKMHERFGKLPWSSLFRAGDRLCGTGFSGLGDRPASCGRLPKRCKAAGAPESARVFLPGNRPPRTGDLFRNPELAAAYRLLAEEGAAAFYQGRLAAAILQTSRRMGGTMTADDLASYSAEWVEPISIDYRGWRVFELPPNGQGMAALEMLNIMERCPADPSGPSSAGEMHRRIEAMKLAYADVYRYNADPRCCRFRSRRCFPSTTRASARRSSIRRRPTAMPAPDDAARQRHRLSDRGRPRGQHRQLDPEHLQQLRLGNHGGRHGLRAAESGRRLHARPGHPNVLAGGKRPFHTIIPGFMERGELHIGFGIMGGANQPLAHAQFVSNVVDYGMNLQQAMEAPAVFQRRSLRMRRRDRIARARMRPCASSRRWATRSHCGAKYSQEMGRGQAILHDSRTGTNYAASDPRSDGAAMPEPIG